MCYFFPLSICSWQLHPLKSKPSEKGCSLSLSKRWNPGSRPSVQPTGLTCCPRDWRSFYQVPVKRNPIRSCRMSPIVTASELCEFNAVVSEPWPAVSPKMSLGMALLFCTTATCLCFLLWCSKCTTAT